MLLVKKEKENQNKLLLPWFRQLQHLLQIHFKLDGAGKCEEDQNVFWGVNYHTYHHFLDTFINSLCWKEAGFLICRHGKIGTIYCIDISNIRQKKNGIKMNHDRKSLVCAKHIWVQFSNNLVSCKLGLCIIINQSNQNLFIKCF